MRPVDLAEQALVGALLLRPDRVANLEWLRAADFADAGCAAVFDHISLAHARGVPLTADRVRRHFLATPTSVHPQLVGGARLADFMSQTPLRPHPEVYARIVLEASVHRLAERVGLRFASRSDDRPPPEITDGEQAVLTGVRQRLATSERSGAHLPPYREARYSRGAVADHQMAAESSTLSALLYKPDQIADVRRWLTPPDFGSADRAATYAAMLDLHGSGTPVDLVTVAWQQHRYAATRGGGVPIERLREMTLTGPVDAEPPARDVVRASVHRQVRASGTAIVRDARDPRRDAAELIRDINDRLNRLKRPPSGAPSSTAGVLSTAPHRPDVQHTQRRQS